MKVAHDCHLTYCTNIHPGEDWPALFAQLKTHLPLIKQTVCPNQPFGVGLRLSARAAAHLCQNEKALQRFIDWLAQEQLYVFTLNGFPYGKFHQTAVKENVYQPDWRAQERYKYSCQLAEILSRLLPENETGSISTVPIGFDSEFTSNQHLIQAAHKLLDFAAFLIELKASTGKTIQLALEPEPGCVLQTTTDIIAFFSQYLYCASAIQTIESKLKRSVSLASIKQHLGLCLDTCHAAVMFENCSELAAKVMAADIPIYKIQLTAALAVEQMDNLARQQLEKFADDVYLHQTSIIDHASGNQRFYIDLPEALTAIKDNDQLRSHFHVPVFHSAIGALQTTQSDLKALLDMQAANPLSKHLEVETYTFDVLPPALRTDNVVEAITREIQWVKELLQ